MAIFSHPIVNQLLQAAIHGISLNHSDANRSISKFIQEIIDVARGKRVCFNFKNKFLKYLSLGIRRISKHCSTSFPNDHREWTSIDIFCHFRGTFSPFQHTLQGNGRHCIPHNPNG